MKSNLIKSATALLLAAGIFALSLPAFAASSDTQTVTFSVAEINELEMSGDPPPLVIGTAPAGQGASPVTDSSTSYAITTNESNRSITAQINQLMPAGLTLEVTLQAPSLTSGTSEGAVALTLLPQTVVSDIDAVNASGRTITYRLSTTTGAPQSNTTRVVTYTITGA